MGHRGEHARPQAVGGGLRWGTRSSWGGRMALPRSPARTTSDVPRPSTSSMRFVPAPINRVEDTGLSQLWLQDLALKSLYFRGYLTGFQAAEAMALPFAGMVDQIFEALKREKV